MRVALRKTIVSEPTSTEAKVSSTWAGETDGPFTHVSPRNLLFTRKPSFDHQQDGHNLTLLWRDFMDAMDHESNLSQGWNHPIGPVCFPCWE